VIYALDETEQRLREEVEEHKRLKVIFNNLSNVALALYDAQTGRLVMGSARYLERAASVHRLKPDELVGRNWQELTLIPSQEQATQIWQMVLEGQRPIHIAELSREIRPGEMLVWDNTLTPIFDADEPGMVRFILVSAVDVTEQVRVRKELETLGQLKDELLSLASHELRSPLTVIQGNTQLLQRDIKKRKKTVSDNTEQVQRIDREVALLDKIVDQTGRINELITEMLDAARIRGQVFELKRKEDVNIVGLVRSVIAQYTQDDSQRNITLRSEEDAILGVWDENRLVQVFNNLITNALKYSPADKPVVVEVKRQSGNPENEVLVAVQDQGPGIPEEDHAAVFNRFYRVKSAEHKSREGLGLGLYIAREIVTQHGGRIWVDSSLGEGCTFYFTLPLDAP
jgi:signal transduction histidine kinase